MAPEGLILDGWGNLLIADSAGNFVHRTDSSTGILTIVAGNGSFEFSGDNRPATEVALGYPVDLALDQSGNLYVLDFSNGRVRAVKGPIQ